jgi:hypothetical protein
MQTQGKFAKLAVLLIAGCLLLSLTTLAAAESDAVRELYVSAANVSTNIPGIRTYAEPPKGFNPLTATDVELATYGFPPRPDKRAEPDHYALWERVMQAAKIRWNGELKPLPGMGHGMIPARSSPLSQAVQPQATGPQQISTINTSGVVLTNKQTKWSSKNSFYAVYAIFSVPTPAFPYGISCSSGNGYGAGVGEYSLVGIDGLFGYDPVEGANPVFEPGLASGVWELNGAYQGSNEPCSPGAALAVFGYFWPDDTGIKYATFNPNLGDVFFAEVELTGPSNAYLYLSDLTTFTEVAYSVTTSGLVGQNAEWMVSRTCCDNPYNVYGTYQLSNTANIFFDLGYAETGNGKYFYPGSQATSTLILTMTDDKGDQAIETVNQGSAGYQGQHSLSFTTVNCAYDLGCTQ